MLVFWSTTLFCDYIHMGFKIIGLGGSALV
jgi:hypothetical protein